MKKFAGLFKLNGQDLLRGLYMAVMGAVLGIIEPLVQSGSFDFDWVLIGKTALSVGGLYIVKQLLTPVPKVVAIDPAKTAVIDIKNKEVISEAKTAPAP
jgi:hypothetical protein